jgi:predicted TIM-barrel fold metal-dependent hydrolase
MRIFDAYCIFGRWPLEPRDVSLERLLQSLSDLGVEKGLACSLRGVFYDHGEGNAETLRACREHPRLVPAATLRPSAYALKGSLPAELAGQGFKLLRLFPDLQEWVTTEGVLLERILAECAEAGLPVAVSVAKKAGVASALARLAPKGCRVILSYVYYTPLAECLEVMRRRPEFLMELGRTCMPFSIELFCRELGADRLLLGTRTPLDSGRGSIEMLLQAEVSDQDRAAILGGNLSRLLGGI